MIYLTSFTFPSEDRETDYLWGMGCAYDSSYYPFRVLSRHELTRLDFAPVTILYGGNGSGKSTALNIIAEKVGLRRDSAFHKTRYFPDYTEMCGAHIADEIPENSRIITSDDVFDFMLELRCLNAGIKTKREELVGEYLDVKYAKFQMKSLADYEQLRRVNKARSKTQTSFVKSELMNTVPEHSNGETAFRYFVEKIEESGLYLLDEPENSLAPKLQLELRRFLEDSARFFGCQFVLSTHSPFLLSMKGARIYDLDGSPATVKRWTELENVRSYYDFFRSHEAEFT